MTEHLFLEIKNYILVTLGILHSLYILRVLIYKSVAG